MAKTVNVYIDEDQHARVRIAAIVSTEQSGRRVTISDIVRAGVARELGRLSDRYNHGKEWPSKLSIGDEAVAPKE